MGWGGVKERRVAGGFCVAGARSFLGSPEVRDSSWRQKAAPPRASAVGEYQVHRQQGLVEPGLEGGVAAFGESLIAEVVLHQLV